MTNSSNITIELKRNKILIRWPCVACGGYTKKVAALAEGEDEDGEIIVCETCLEDGNIDARLEKHAERLEGHAAWLRGLIGKLNVPSFESWKALAERHGVALCAYRDYDKVMSDDAVYAEWRDRLQGFVKPLQQEPRPLSDEFPFEV